MMKIDGVYTHPELLGDKIEIGELFFKGNVLAVNIGKDLVEKWVNIVGGKMKRYSDLLEKVFHKTVLEVVEEARASGYDGIVGLRAVSPTVVEGGIEIVLYGNGFRWKR